MFLGNIVSKSKTDLNKFFYLTDNIKDIKDGIPTLIIGWDFTKSLFSDQKLSILNKNISKSVFWTFSKTERRVDYERDIDNFISLCIKTVEKNLKYQYINILTDPKENIKKIIKNGIKTGSCYIYIYKNSFIYALFNGSVIGIDFNMIDFLNIDRKKIYSRLYKKADEIIFNDNFLPKQIKENIKGNNKIIPYLYETYVS